MPEEAARLDPVANASLGNFSKVARLPEACHVIDIFEQFKSVFFETATPGGQGTPGVA
jgi:hypothetical protein